MPTIRVEFENEQGYSLSGRLELPELEHPHTFALFAHAFTGNKNLNAVRIISRTLAQEGFGVLRFDFTGLGDSEGDFADTSFSSNVDDLVAAANFLKENYQMPKLMIGHSLGGAATVFAASKLPDVSAVVTIGAPGDTEHVQHLFEDDLDTIEREGQARVNIGGRPFTIKKEFVLDLKEQQMRSVLFNMRKPLLVFHSPQDKIVEIEQAKRIYSAAHHPKSFISLHGADHMLTNRRDAAYVGDAIASWAARYIDRPEEAFHLTTDHEVAVCTPSEGFTSKVVSGKHRFKADEPVKVGGNDFGPSPYDFLSTALGACTTMTLQMYARRKGWDLQEAIVHVDHHKTYRQDSSEKEYEGKIDQFKKHIEFRGNLSEEQKNRLLEIADKCPVHRTLHSEIDIVTDFA